MTREALFWRKVDKSGPVPSERPELGSCWMWTATKNRGGYGRVTIAKANRAAHRVSYELVKGAIPIGFQIDHLCKRPACVNPDHLEAVTPAENNRRSSSPSALNMRATHCPKGHAYVEANIIRRRDRRQCRRCQIIANARWAKNTQASLRSAGLCYVCRAPSTGFYCEPHREQHKLRQRAIAAAKRQEASRHG